MDDSIDTFLAIGIIGIIVTLMVSSGCTLLRPLTIPQPTEETTQYSEIV
jgi:hypothetical protein